MKREVDLMLDSGAYSAFKKGERVDLSAYIGFVQRNIELLESYVNLDVIPGKPGRTGNQDEVKEAAASSWKNFLRMRRTGLEPIPVFHYGEDLDWLRRILDSGAPRIGLGGTVGRPAILKRKFFTESFNQITKFRPSPKAHGFGTTSWWTMKNYPWDSVDSTSWVLGSANGSILVPPDFAGKLRTVRVTGDGNPHGQAAGMGDYMWNHLDKYLVSVGTSLAAVRADQGLLQV